MKYRWGFLDENDIFSECQPKVDDSTAIDFTQESGEIFYRGKINGSLAFRFEFDDILAKGYNYEHRIVLQWYDADNDLWKDVWKGRFALTDCEIDFDTKTITVQPTTLDRYTKIIDALESEYNLVKLAPNMQPVNINIRPCLQIYCSGESKITNYVGESFWEATCDSNTNPTELTNTYHFEKIGEVYAAGFTVKKTWFGETTYIKIIAYTNNTERDASHNIYLTGSDGNTYRCAVFLSGTERRYTLFDENDDWLFEAYYDGYAFDHIYENPLLAYEINPQCQWSVIMARILLQTELSQITLLDTTLQTYSVPLNDISGAINLNYNKVAPCTTACVKFVSSVTVQDDPTEYGICYNDKYFVRYLETNYNPLPIAPAQWLLCSLWVVPYFRYRNYIDNYSAKRKIKDCYTVIEVVKKLASKTGWNGNVISGILNTENYAGYAVAAAITAKSNVISSYYDTPAQNAPITLAKVLSMLKYAYQIYWYIDNNGDIHIEHVNYFDNGYSYNEEMPVLIVDLETELHTNTKNNKVFGQNKVKFDKQDMPEIYSFGWMDIQTKPFDGYQIKCLDQYIQKGVKDEISVGSFSTDIDFILSSPNDVSKEGFVFFGCPVISGNPQWDLNIEEVNANDEDGITIKYRLQNANAAFIKIHENMWRYALPCENVNINNADTTAITTGRFKVQNVEFADSVMAEILKDIDNCNKVIRTQQGDGHIKTLSINLNSLVAKGDLLFNFVGRWYYLKGTALGNSIIIFVNGESTTIEVNANKFTHRYKEPIATLKFNAADVVSVNFADCDKLDNLTSCDEMFDGCEELLAVDFGNKTFGAVTSANNMFRGCVALTTLICPDSSTWKADLDFSDCPDLTLESFYDLIKFLYYYNAGVHTITPNTTFWNALDADTQNDLLTKASARGWTIGIPAQYSISGQSAANTVYATINGSPVEISVVGGSWQYDYNAPITSISFENDADVTDIDFSLSDGLAGLTSLNDAFKNCAGLTTVDFTNCDLSNVASASDAFAGCVALYELIIPQDTWQPDVDLSDGVMPKTEMLNVINGLYDYTSGTHTITFNQTIWDAMSVADQQIVFDAADAKGWTTNAVAVIYTISGKSTAATETFTIQFIQDGSMTPDAVETITVAVDGNGDWSFSYTNKKIYSLEKFAQNNTTITSVNFSNADNFTELTSIKSIFEGATSLATITKKNNHFAYVTVADYAFNNCASLNIDNFANETFAAITNAQAMFNGLHVVTFELANATFENTTDITLLFGNNSYLKTVNLPSATFNHATVHTYEMWNTCANLETLNMPSATFKSLTSGRAMFFGMRKLSSIDLSSATFENITDAYTMFNQYGNHPLQTLSMPEATFAKVTNAYAMFILDGLVTLNMPKATFASVTNTGYMFADLKNMTTFNVAIETFPISYAFQRSNSGIAMTYQSMLNAANWCKDRTGLSAQTLTFNATAWGNLSAAEQTTIDGILSAKNWTRAIA